MAVPIKCKQVLGSLEHEQRAVLRFSYYEAGSSGSEHGGGGDLLSSSSGDLSVDLLYGYSETGATLKDSSEGDGRDKEDDEEEEEDGRAAEVGGLVSLYNKVDSAFRLRLYHEVVKATEVFAGLKLRSPSGYRRAVMARLRELGCNAGICKAKWEASGELAAGNYECIDVAVGRRRYIVDLEFAAEFEIARATARYERLAAVLPRVMVAETEEVRQVVRTMAEAAKRSLKSRGLCVPPWRKRRYMVNKWLGPYRRTTNLLPVSSGAAGRGGEVVKCRTVGFTTEPVITRRTYNWV